MLNNNLKYCREELEMTQAELGIILGSSKQIISNWETGYTSMPLNKLGFCNLYNYSLDFVVGFVRQNTNYNKSFKLDKDKICKRLNEIRTKLHLTQQEVSNMMNMSQVQVSRKEKKILQKLKSTMVA